jgi:hypothetical protein
MPKITQQRKQQPKPAALSSDVVNRVKPLKEVSVGTRFSVYGRGKTGKTRLGCTFPKPLLLIGTEEGTRSVAGVKGVDFVMLKHSEELEPLVGLVASKYKSVVIDNASGLQDLVLKEVLGLADVPVQKSWGIARQQDWGTCAMQMKERLRPVLNLYESGKHVVVIAHERSFTDEGDSDLIFPTVGSALTPSVTGWLNGAVDYICQTFIREQTKTVTRTIGTKESTMQQKTGKKEFCLRVGPHPVYMTGFRLSPGTELPDSIVDPSYNKLVKLINGKG